MNFVIFLEILEHEKSREGWSRQFAIFLQHKIKLLAEFNELPRWRFLFFSVQKERKLPHSRKLSP